MGREEEDVTMLVHQRVDTLAGRLERALGAGRVLADPVLCAPFGTDATHLEGCPALVVRPQSTDEVAATVRLVGEAGLALIPRGAGTNLSGGVIPTEAGREVVLDLAGLTGPVAVDVPNMVAVARPGVITAAVHTAAEAVDLFYPPDPSSCKRCTIGGNVAENAGGPRCLKYGVTGHYVLGLEVVLAGGQVARLGGRTVKNVTGYQLHQLFVGSEGTLGVITEVTLRLIPRPRLRRTALAAFADLDDAGRAVGAILHAGVLPCAVELLDGFCIRAVRDALGVDLPDAAALLLVEVDGNHAAALDADIAAVADAARQAAATLVRRARSEAEAEECWAARKAVNETVSKLRPHRLSEDVSVPRTAIPAMLRRAEAISREHGIPIPVYGHAGDGNLHPVLLFDRNDREERARTEAAGADLFRAALALGGTLSGEHGIGLLKRPFLPLAVDGPALAAMRTIKAALDPADGLNRGKIFP
jgi:glycolate oxidase